MNLDTNELGLPVCPECGEVMLVGFGMIVCCNEDCNKTLQNLEG